MPEDEYLHEMSYLPDVLSGTTKYARLSNIFRSKITSGSWPVGYQIPTIDQLSKDYNVARITIRQAINRLVVDGLARSERGRGTFVIASASNGQVDPDAFDASEFGPTGRIRILSCERDAELPTLLRRGRRSIGKYTHIKKTNSLGSQVLFMMDFYVSPDLYNKYLNGKESQLPMQDLLKPHFFEADIMVDTLVHIIFTDHLISEVLGCQISSTSSELIRTFYDLDGSVIAASSTIYQPGMFRYKMTQTAREYFRSKFPSNTSTKR